MTGMHRDLCSDAVFALLRKDSLDKSRRKSSLNHDAFSPALRQLSLFPKEAHMFSKMSHASIRMTAVNLMEASLFPEELYTCSKMGHYKLYTC